MRVIHKIIFTIMGVFTTIVNTEAIQPLDGNFHGSTSKGQALSFIISNGEIENFNFNLYPACGGIVNYAVTNLKIIQKADDSFVFHRDVNVDDNGILLGV